MSKQRKRILSMTEKTVFVVSSILAVSLMELGIIPSGGFLYVIAVLCVANLIAFTFFESIVWTAKKLRSPKGHKINQKVRKSRPPANVQNGAFDSASLAEITKLAAIVLAAGGLLLLMQRGGTNKNSSSVPTTTSSATESCVRPYSGIPFDKMPLRASNSRPKKINESNYSDYNRYILDTQADYVTVHVFLPSPGDTDGEGKPYDYRSVQVLAPDEFLISKQFNEKLQEHLAKLKSKPIEETRNYLTSSNFEYYLKYVVDEYNKENGRKLPNDACEDVKQLYQN